MKNRTPVAREDRPALPDFTPVPRRCARHDGWTPERQKAFIEALADTGSVSRAAAMVNMSSEGAYYLRRQPGAEEFRRAWEAALDYGVARMKDIAFERAIEGYLVPCFVGGKLIGWRRKHNDRLLMFCLRHYGEDASGKRTTINYFSTKAVAGSSSAPSVATPARSAAGAARRDASPDRPAAGEAEPFDVTDSLRDGAAALAAAETSVTSVRTTMRESSGRDLDSSTAVIDSFAGVPLDETAQAEILAILRACAERRRAVDGTPDDPDEPFIAAEQPLQDMVIRDELTDGRPRTVRGRPRPAYDVVATPEQMLEHDPRLLIQPDELYRSGEGERRWEMLDDEAGMQAIEDAVESVKRARAPSVVPPAQSAAETARRDAKPARPAGRRPKAD